VGIKATNALSEWLEVRVRRDGVVYCQRHENGLPVTPVQILDPNTGTQIGVVGQEGEEKAIKKHAVKKLGTGTTITFKPNPRYMDITEFDFDAMARRLQVIAFLLPGVTVEFKDARKKKVREKVYRYAGGLVEYVNWLNEDRKAIHRQPIEVSGSQNGTTVEVVFQWHTSVDDSEIVSFVNTIPTPDGETRGRLQERHHQGHQPVRHGKKAPGCQERGRDSRADTLAGLTAVLKLSMHDPHLRARPRPSSPAIMCKA